MRYLPVIAYLLLPFILIGNVGKHKPQVKKINQRTINVLFVGNSLTYSNDLPALVKEEASKIDFEVKTKTVAHPNYALMDHWNDGKVQKMIKNGNYDFVIVQQGPSSQEFGKQVLFEYGEKFKKLCGKNGAKLVYFMVWPSRTYYRTFDAVIKNHNDAAKANDALVCPVGEVWKQHFDTTNDFSYYGDDGFHPSLEGSKVAARVICETLF
ncbi:SGNH/GDSL hydrolase family protein [Allomuricauda sp. d1]|uniref:SGNH/GDSL hydrolase family protein n=1 Tax=Allomuricauda sp. d1 TaxID=3136725 RepID=UPI0031D89C32